VSLNLIVAACSNRGIGINGRLPWKLRLGRWRETACDTVVSSSLCSG